LAPPPLVSLGFQLFGILVTKPLKSRFIRELDARKLARILRQLPRRLGAVTAEMEEPNRGAIDLPTAVPGDRPIRQVPPSHVQPRVPQDRMVEKRRHEIDPTLINESPQLRSDDAFPGEALGPPVEECHRAPSDRDEAKVEHARAQQEGLAGLLAIARERRERVRRPSDPVAAGLLIDVVQRCEDPDVWIEIRDRLVFLEKRS